MEDVHNWHVESGKTAREYHVESGKTAREYLAALFRHKVQIFAVTAVLSAVAVFVAMSLPPVYRSSATILVQEQEVPPELVRSTITSFADERIQVISQQVMTRAVLLQLIDKYELYRKDRGRVSTDDILERMRKDIKLSTVNADISDRSSGRRVNATIAFKLSYDAPQPESAQKVVEELVLLYLNENVKARQQSVAETNAFLAQEGERLAKQIQAIEGKLAEFKRRNVGRMPESSTVNVQLAERTESELQRVERDLSLHQDRKLSLEAQLATVRPNLVSGVGTGADRNLAPEERMRALQARYAGISGVYGEDHPDVRRVKREIAALKAEMGAQGNVERADQLTRLDAELAALKDRYGDDHPDVQRLKRSIAALNATKSTPAAAQRGNDKQSVADVIQNADNPAYIVLATQLEGVKRELSQLSSLRDDLRARQRTYDARLLQIPEVEREYSELTRDYSNAQTRYREIKSKQLQAEGALELEMDSKAERFSLGEPANLPQRPFSPNRPAIVLMGFVASLGSGLALAWLREAVDPSVKGPLELARIASVPILTAIPYIKTRREQVGNRRRILLAIGISSVAGALFLIGLHFLARPLPDLVDSILHKMAIW